MNECKHTELFHRTKNTKRLDVKRQRQSSVRQTWVAADVLHQNVLCLVFGGLNSYAYIRFTRDAW